MLKKITLIALSLILIAGTARGENVIVFATDASWPPMEFMSADKRIVGFGVDYMTAAGKEAGFTPKFRVVAWDGIFPGLATGKYDAICSSVSITEERKKVMDFSVPYFKVRQVLVVHKDSQATSLEDLKGKRVGAQLGSTGYFAVKKAGVVEPKSYDEIGLAMEDLFNGRIHGVVCDDPVATQYALTSEKYKTSLKIGGVVGMGDAEYYGVAVRKGDKETLDLVNKGIEAVKSKGLDKEILKNWIRQ